MAQDLNEKILVDRGHQSGHTSGEEVVMGFTWDVDARDHLHVYGWRDGVKTEVARFRQYQWDAVRFSAPGRRRPRQDMKLTVTDGDESRLIPSRLPDYAAAKKVR